MVDVSLIMNCMMILVGTDRIRDAASHIRSLLGKAISMRRDVSVSIFFDAPLPLPPPCRFSDDRVSLYARNPIPWERFGFRKDGLG